MTIPQPLRDGSQPTGARYVAGVDGGATKTIAAILDLETLTVSMGRAGPTNADAVGIDAAATQLEIALGGALSAAGIDGPALGAGVFGLAGTISPTFERRIRSTFSLRAGYFVKEYVYRIEEAVIRTLGHFGVTGHRVSGAPGIYVKLDAPAGHARPAQGSGFEGLGKIAALGIKVSNHCAYHGLAFNVAMQLDPFARINPCGYAGLVTVDLATLGVHASWDDVALRLGARLAALLSAREIRE